MFSISLIILCCLLQIVASTPASQNSSVGAYASRTYFYVGGHYENVVSIISTVEIIYFKPSNPPNLSLSAKS